MFSFAERFRPSMIRNHAWPRPMLARPARHNQNETACLHRLDERAGVRADVSDALLRFVDEPGGQEVVFADCLVAARRDASRAVVYFFGGRIVCAGDREIAREGNRAQRDRETDYFARRGDFWN